jgi:hypothetical protein
VVIRVPQLGSIKISTQLLAQEFPGTEVPGFTTIVNCSVEAVSISKLDALFLDLRSCDLIGKCLATYLPAWPPALSPSSAVSSREAAAQSHLTKTNERFRLCTAHQHSHHLCIWQP